MSREEVTHLTKYGCAISIAVWLTLAVNLLRLISDKVIEIPSVDVAASMIILFIFTACENLTFYAFSFYLLSKEKQDTVEAVYKNLSTPMVINLFFCVSAFLFATSYYVIAKVLTLTYSVGTFWYYVISTRRFSSILDGDTDTHNNKLDFNLFEFFMLQIMGTIIFIQYTAIHWF